MKSGPGILKTGYRKRLCRLLESWSSEFIEEHFGNGGQEIHNWLVLHSGPCKTLKPSVACYEPIPEWVTGMAIVQFQSVG